MKPVGLWFYDERLGVHVTRADRIVKKYVRDRFVVTMKDGQTWNGLLTDADTVTLSLADVQAISPDGSRVKADGEIFLPRADVAYMQKA